ncbi:MAG TPA: hypothetical protein VGN20_03545 [Mucilaginibacter sp.]
MKKRIVSFILLAAMYVALSTSCAPPHHLSPPPAPPAPPSPGR